MSFIPEYYIFILTVEINTTCFFLNYYNFYSLSMRTCSEVLTPHFTPCLNQGVELFLNSIFHLQSGLQSQNVFSSEQWL